MMRRATAVFGAAAIVLGSVGAFAQAKPSFSGNWTPDAEKTMVANPGQAKAVPAARPMVIKQDLAFWTMERQGAATGPRPVQYSLNNQPMEVTSSRTQGPAQVRARWAGDTIVFETTHEEKGVKVITSVTYAREGTYLVVTSREPDGSGGTKIIATYYGTTK